MICNNSILTIHKKNKLQAFQSFPLYFTFIFLSIQAFSQVCLHPSSPAGISSCYSFFSSISLLFHSSVSSRERHTPRLRRVLSAPCGASNSGTDFFLAGFHPSTPSLPDALKVIAATYSFPRYGRGIVAAA